MVQIERIPGTTQGGGLMSDARPIHDAMAFGLLVGVGVATSPAVKPAVQFSGMAATGLVPGGTELIMFLASRGWFRLTPVMTAGGVAATAVGLVNLVKLYEHRYEIYGRGKEYYEFIKRKIDAEFTPDLNFLSLSTPGEDAAAPGPLKTRESTRGGSAPYSRRRRKTAPWCFTHKKRHWCKFTRNR